MNPRLEANAIARHIDAATPRRKNERPLLGRSRPGVLAWLAIYTLLAFAAALLAMALRTLSIWSVT
jgi:hypothetical protein